MSKIKSFEELLAIRDSYKKNLDLREKSESEDVIKVVVGMATCGIASGAKETFVAIQEELSKQGIKNVKLTQTGCMGSCYAEPVVEVTFPGQESILYGNVTAECGREIVRKHLKDGELVQNLIIGKPFEKA